MGAFWSDDNYDPKISIKIFKNDNKSVFATFWLILNLTEIQYNYIFSSLSRYNFNEDSILGSHGDPKHSLQGNLQCM